MVFENTKISYPCANANMYQDPTPWCLEIPKSNALLLENAKVLHTGAWQHQIPAQGPGWQYQNVMPWCLKMPKPDALMSEMGKIRSLDV